MAVRILMLVTVLMALYGCGQSPETKDSSEGVEPLSPEASVFGTVVLTGQNVELEANMMEQADQEGRLLAYVYLECGYGLDTCPPEPWYEDLYHWFFHEERYHLLVGAALLLLVCAAVLSVPVLIWRFWTRR